MVVFQHVHNFFDLSADAWNRLTRVQCDVRVSHGLDRYFNDVEGSRSLLVGADGRGHSDGVALVARPAARAAGALPVVRL